MLGFVACVLVLRNLSRLQHGEVKVVAADVERLGVSMYTEAKHTGANHMDLSSFYF